MELDKIIEKSPHNFVIRDAIEKCFDVIQKHNKIACHVSGGADSDVMLDMMLRCGAKEKTDFSFITQVLSIKQHMIILLF